MQADLIFRLFVYGTLKRGYSNHDLFCDNALNAEEATTCGDLYDLPFGFPAMVVPSKSVLAVGTTDYAFDASEQYKLNAAARKPGTDKVAKVFGEIFTFDNPTVRLPKLDHLEGFDPAGSSLYRRILIPVDTATDIVLAWAYATEKPTGTRILDGHWPPA